MLAELAALGVVGIRINWSKRKTLPDPFASDYQDLFCGPVTLACTSS